MPRRIQSTPWQPFAAYNVCAARACHWCSYLNCTLHAYCCQALSRTRFDPHVAYPTHTHETLSSLVCRHTPMFTVSSLVRIAIVADALRSLLSVLRTSRMLPLALFFFGCVATGWYNISPMGFALVSHGLVSGRSTHEDVDVSTHIQNGVAKASVPLMPYEGAGT